MTDPPGRVLGIDFGTKRVGVAVSDPRRVIAGSVCTLPNDNLLLDRLSAVIREQEAVLAVVGMPYAPDGGKGVTALAVEEFVQNLRKHVSIPVETWDESGTSVRASEVLRTSGMKRKRRQEKGRVDAMAARILLQEFLEEHASSHPMPSRRP
jgi:putative Holliday junction resolvase